MDVLGALEHVGIFVFAVSGAVTAMEKRMDLFGIFVLSFITAMGGGVLRDMVLGIVPMFFSSYYAIYNILIATSLAIVFKGSFARYGIISLFDAVGLAAFVTDAGVKAIALGANLPLFLFTAIISGVGGGVIRDVLCQRVPLILRKEVYASAGLIGAALLWFAHPLVGLPLSRAAALVIIVAIRMVSLKYRARLPVVQVERHGLKSTCPHVEKSDDQAVDKETHLC